MPPIPSTRNNDYDYAAEARTSSATPELLFNVLTYSGGCYKAKVYIAAVKQSNGDCGGWEISATFKNVAGVATIVGEPTYVSEDRDDVTWEVTLSTSGNFLNVYITGATSSDILWRGDINIKRLQLIK